MASNNYKMNMRNIAIALLKVVFAFIISQILIHFWHTEFYKPIVTYGNKRILPVHLMTLYICVFTTAQLIKIVKNFIHVPINDMQISEDIQLIVGHICMQKLSKII